MIIEGELLDLPASTVEIVHVYSTLLIQYIIY